MDEKILMVDDNENALKAFQRALRKDFKLEVAKSAGEAIQKVKLDGPFAVVISDMKMPGANGVEFLALVKSISPNSSRIMLTGYAEKQTTVDALETGGAMVVLTKPCPIKKLKNSILEGLQLYRHNVINNAR